MGQWPSDKCVCAFLHLCVSVCEPSQGVLKQYESCQVSYKSLQSSQISLKITQKWPKIFPAPQELPPAAPAAGQTKIRRLAPLSRAKKLKI